MATTIILDDDQEAVLRQLLDSGRFSDAASAVAAGLQALAADDPGGWSVEALRAELAKAGEDGPAIPAEEVFAELRQMLADGFGPDPRK
jgi:Arc/MetJ-type ribon-helix-helix transcriptional regulator